MSSVVYANPMPLLAAILYALVWSDRAMRPGRRLVGVAFLAAVAVYSLVCVCVAERPETLNRWDDSTCLQSSETTCSAAAAATLLAHHGIAASEEVMVNLCLTDAHGTRLHGLYRGLRAKTANTPYRVAVRKANLSGLKDKKNLPALLFVGLTDEAAKREPRYSEKWGWIVGVTHAIVLFDLSSDGGANVADPAMGREHWDEQALNDLWRGVMMYLEKEDAT